MSARRTTLKPIVAAIAIGLSFAVQAQPGAPFTQPADTRPELPRFEPEDRPRTDILPRFAPSPRRELDPLLRGTRIFIEQVLVEGATVLSDADLAEITGPYEAAWITFADLEALRDRITFAYVQRGYLTSGAVIPDQEVVGGVVRIQVVEGVLARMEVSTDGRLRPGYVESRIEEATRAPINVNAIEQRLQIVQQDERIRRIEARLLPAERRGESRLELDVEEERPYALDVEVGNLESPSIGGWRARFSFAHRNITGSGDSVFVSYRRADGLDAVEGFYSVPVSPRDTRIDVHGEVGHSEVVEAPLDQLDVEGDYYTLGVGVHQPVYRTRNARLALSLAADRRRSESTLLGFPFSFTPGEDGGVSRVFVLRFRQDWSYRAAEQAASARSTFSFGLDALGATANDGELPDGQFIAWLGQVQWARRLPVHQAELLVRADVQLSNDALLPLEQITLGGFTTVRGYRERSIIADNGAIGSIELRVPIYQSSLHQVRVELAPFFDVGRAWFDGRVIDDVKLMSVGIGARASIARRGALEVYWGHALRNKPDWPEYDLQDSGVSLRFFWAL